jgi:hypothetical protein
MRHFRKENEYSNDKINMLPTNSETKNTICLLRGINEFKRYHNLRNNLVKYENENLLADSHSI